MNFNRLSDKHLKTLFRLAKSKKHGLRPFFANPQSMIRLREEAEKRGVA